ncbi:MAG: M28 family peptidase [Planctomycetota bacterium]
MFAGFGIAAAIIGACYAWAVFSSRAAESGPPFSTLTLQDIPFNGERAFGYLKQLCDLGPRPSGSQGMLMQQQVLEKHFRQFGAEVVYQRFRVPHPRERTLVPMANMIIHWHPESKERILLCAHYDTLPYPMLDPQNPQGRFVGANDNASGVSVLMELAHDMAKLDTPYGVDFLLVDGEEFIFSHQDRYFLGSEYFSREYVKNPPPYRYRWGVLLDMIGDKDLQIYKERNSVRWRHVRPLVEEIWATAERLGVREFIPRVGHEVRDDHVMLTEVGKIPTCDLIDFDYKPWHTENDVPEQCSPLSLAKVGWVVRTWLEGLKR